MTNINLLHGDCLELLKEIPDASVDAIICDPPYGTTQAKWDIALNLDSLWKEYLRITKDNAPIILFSAQPFTSKLVMSQSDYFRYMWYWEKEKGTNFLSVARQPLRVIEEISVFAKSGSYTYNPQMVPLDKPYRHTMPIKETTLAGANNASKRQAETSEREYKTYTHAHPKNLLSFSRDNANKSLVPTQKPVALLEYLIRTYSDDGDVILDNTMGSGTTGVACKKLGRSFIGMEYDEDHYRIASDRINATVATSDEIFKIG
jgi:DNA modification methylase